MSRNGMTHSNGYTSSADARMQSSDSWNDQKLPVGRPPLNPGNKEYRCIMCRPNELFDTKYFLEKHIKQKHVGFSFVCPVCPDNENFTSKYFLDKHMKQWHNPNGVYNRSTSNDNGVQGHHNSNQSHDNNKLYNGNNVTHHNGDMTNGRASNDAHLNQRSTERPFMNGHGPVDNGFI